MELPLDDAIARHAETVFAFLEDLVAADSVLGREQGAMEAFERGAQSVGLTTRRMPFVPGPLEDARAGIAPSPEKITADRFQVFATSPGDGPLHLLLNGHLDVVPAQNPELWTNGPFNPTRREGRLYGRGALDMKSGFAVGLLALHALRDVETDLFRGRRIGFVAVIEEECTGNGVLRTLSENGIAAPEVVVLEPTDLGLLLGGVGVLWVDIKVITSAGHANVAGQSVNAVDLGLRLVEGLRAWSASLRQSDPEPELGSNTDPYAVNLGKVDAGDWTSSSPATATFGIRLGYPRGWSADLAEARVRAAVRDLFKRDPDFRIEPVVTLTGFRAEGYLIDRKTPLVQDLMAAHVAAHGEPPHSYMSGSTTDARIYLNNFGIPAVCYGATGANMHGIDEYVELDSIVQAARTLTRFIIMRFGQGRS